MPLGTNGNDATAILAPQPQRIISLVPSQTELLYDLALADRVAGITKFCVHPQEWHQTKPRIGGTKNVNIPKVHSLHPDLILAAKEENVKEQVEELARFYPVWTSDVHCLQDAIEMISQVGKLTGTEGNAQSLASAIQSAFAPPNNDAANISALMANDKRTVYRAAYLIWNEPLMAAGGDTFISDMMQHAGFANIFGHENRYPVVTPQEIATLDCDLLLLSSEPYPFGKAHVARFQEVLPKVKAVLVDGEAFSWYGSRLLHSPSYFEQLYREVTRNG